MSGAPQSSRAPWALHVRARPSPGWWIAIALVALALYAPYLGTEELHYEEARRALPAREMLATGDFVLPTIWGRAYLAKPPFFYWCIAAVGALRGTLDELGARLPSLVATIATALGVLQLGARWFTRRAGVAAALCWLLAPAVFNKGGLGEIEAVLALCVLVHLAALPAAVAGSWSAALVSGLGLAAALLSKGPPGLIFCAAGWLALARTQRPAGRALERRVLMDARAWAALGIGLALALAWVALLLVRLDVARTLATWGEELDRSGASDWTAMFSERALFPFAFVGGVLAATLAALVAGRAAWRSLAAEPAFEWIVGTLAIALGVFFLAAPRHRYAYPLTPFLALAGGALFDRRCRLDAGARAAAGARAVAAVFALVGLGFAAAAVPAVREALSIELDLDLLGWLCIALGVGAGLALALGLRRAPLTRLGAGAVLVLAAVRVLTATQYEPTRADRRGFRQAGAALQALVPEGETLYTPVWLHFNALFYVHRPIVWVEHLGQVPRGGYAFVREPGPEVERRFDVAGRFVLDDGAQGQVLVRARRKPGRGRAAPDDDSDD